MRAVVQLVKEASVAVAGDLKGKIGKGYLVLIGIEENDTEKDLSYICEKLLGLRVFEDDAEKMNLSVADVGGEVLLVSQFTLLGDARHGRRPSFSHAARPEAAEPLCDRVRDLLIERGVPTCTGRFRTHMEVDLLNDGPVTILLDSRRAF